MPGQFNNQQVIVARFNANGTLDTTFGDNDGIGGYTRFAVNGNQSFAEDITIDNANGDIYLVGRGANVANTATGFAVMRLKSDGELDASFGTGGIVCDAIRGWRSGPKPGAWPCRAMEKSSSRASKRRVPARKQTLPWRDTTATAAWIRRSTGTAN